MSKNGQTSGKQWWRWSDTSIYIWVNTICSVLSVRILRANAVVIFLWWGQINHQTNPIPSNSVYNPFFWWCSQFNGSMLCSIPAISKTEFPASIFYKSIAGRYRPVSYPDGPITARYRFIKNAYWVNTTNLGFCICISIPFLYELACLYFMNCMSLTKSNETSNKYISLRMIVGDKVSCTPMSSMLE